MSRTLRYLRIAFSVTGGIACVLLAVLWVRSYRVSDHIYWRFTEQKTISVESNWGSAYLRLKGFQNYLSATRLGYSVSNSTIPDTPSKHRFGIQRNWAFAEIKLPHWFLVGLTAAVATLTALPWIPWQFGLRTLLIAMTVIAAILGLIVVSTR